MCLIGCNVNCFNNTVSHLLMMIILKLLLQDKQAAFLVIKDHFSHKMARHHVRTVPLAHMQIRLALRSVLTADQAHSNQNQAGVAVRAVTRASTSLTLEVRSALSVPMVGIVTPNQQRNALLEHTMTSSD